MNGPPMAVEPGGREPVSTSPNPDSSVNRTGSEFAGSLRHSAKPSCETCALSWEKPPGAASAVQRRWVPSPPANHTSPPGIRRMPVAYEDSVLQVEPSQWAIEYPYSPVGDAQTSVGEMGSIVPIPPESAGAPGITFHPPPCSRYTTLFRPLEPPAHRSWGPRAAMARSRTGLPVEGNFVTVHVEPSQCETNPALRRVPAVQTSSGAKTFTSPNAPARPSGVGTSTVCQLVPSHRSAIAYPRPVRRAYAV